MTPKKFKQTEIGKIPEDWEIKKLKEVCIKITDGSHFSPSTKSIGKLIATVKDMEDYGFNYSTCRKISDEDFKKLVKQDCKPLKDDVLIAKDGSYLKHVFVSNGKDEIVILSSIAILRPNPKKISSVFLKYLFTDSRTKERVIGNYVSGAVIPRIVLRDFEKIDLPIPSLPEQLSIAKILSSLDAKIELNNKMNKTLEAIGQAFFKKWFIDGKKEEWREGKLRELGKVICGKTPPTSIKNYFGGKIPFIKIPDMHNNLFILKTNETLTEEGKHFQLNKIIPKGAICVSCIATVGLVSITTEESQTNQQINSIIPREDFAQGYLYYSLKDFKKKLKDIGSGGAVTLNVNTTLFSDIEIIIPDEKTMQNFNQLIKPIFKQISINCFQNQTLSLIRDTLLPKLMSGEIRVK